MFITVAKPETSYKTNATCSTSYYYLKNASHYSKSNARPQLNITWIWTSKSSALPQHGCTRCLDPADAVLPVPMLLQNYVRNSPCYFIWSILNNCVLERFVLCSKLEICLSVICICFQMISFIILFDCKIILVHKIY